MTSEFHTTKMCDQISGRQNTVTSHHIIFALMVRIAICLVLAGTCFSLNAATLPTGFTETSVGGLSSPTAMDIAPDGRIFVCQQGGMLRVIKNGILLSTPFLTLTVDSNGERGLLGIAFDPNFQSNNFLYVYYTVNAAPKHNRVSRFTANGDVAVAGSEMPILDLDNLSGATNHNGGAIHFGPDGKLYVDVGENANGANSQLFTNRLGKMLRINSDGTIPADNPFVNVTTGANQAIWAMGLRNPFTFAFQPGTGRMFINDVGEVTWEEINDGIAGSNYGWNITEGVTTDPRFRSPLFVYGHGSSATTGCAITGGAFYNPATVQFPSSYVGKYFFADLCGGWIRVMDPATNMSPPPDFATGISQPVDLKVGADGSLYYLSIGSGAVFRVQFPASPSITMQPADQTVIAGQPVTFSVTATGAPTLTYQWQRNQVNIMGANATSFMISPTVIGDNGAKFRCVVMNGSGTAMSNEATLTVQPVPASPSITTQPADQTVIAGQSVTFSVTATGAPTLTYQWQRNQVNIMGANATTFMISPTVLGDNGAKFRCVVMNGSGTAMSNEATLTVRPDPPPPVLQFEQTTDHLIAFDSAVMFPDPFLLTNPVIDSTDHRTRIMFFALNTDLLPTENASAVNAQVETSQGTVIVVSEFVGPIIVPGLNGLSEIIIRLPDSLVGRTGDVLVTITLRGKVSNKLRFTLRQ